MCLRLQFVLKANATSYERFKYKYIYIDAQREAIKASKLINTQRIIRVL